MKFGDLLHYGHSHQSVMMYVSPPTPAMASVISPRRWRLAGFDLYAPSVRHTGLDWEPCTDECEDLPSGVRATAADADAPYSGPLTEVR